MIMHKRLLVMRFIVCEEGREHTWTATSSPANEANFRTYVTSHFLSRKLRVIEVRFFGQCLHSTYAEICCSTQFLDLAEYPILIFFYETFQLKWRLTEETIKNQISQRGKGIKAKY